MQKIINFLLNPNLFQNEEFKAKLKKSYTLFFYLLKAQIWGITRTRKTTQSR